jgi:hypothetical protein
MYSGQSNVYLLANAASLPAFLMLGPKKLKRNEVVMANVSFGTKILTWTALLSSKDSTLKNSRHLDPRRRPAYTCAAVAVFTSSRLIVVILVIMYH